MLRDDVQLVSVDDHILEPRNLWSDRLPKSYQESGPHIVELEGGVEAWLYEDKTYTTHALNIAAGNRAEDYTRELVRFSDMRPGHYNSAARLKDMDEDGVTVQLCFPTFPRFAGHRFLEGSDRELSLLCIQAYNDFILDEWVAADPYRFIPMMVLPLWDPGLAVEEINRCAGKGVKAIAFSENPTVLGLPSIHSGHWNPVFAAAQDCGLPMCMHIGSSSKLITSSEDAPYAVHIAVEGCNSLVSLVDYLISDVFINFPRLKVAFSEGGAGWLPYALERTDYAWERHRFHSGIHTDISPSELFRDHVTMCFIVEPFALKNRYDIGVGNLTWESDYPHSDSLWPNSRQVLGELLKEIPDDEAGMIAEGNARALYNFPRRPVES